MVHNFNQENCFIKEAIHPHHPISHRHQYPSPCMPTLAAYMVRYPGALPGPLIALAFQPFFKFTNQRSEQNPKMIKVP